MAISILFNMINVNSVSNGTIAVGENAQNSWDSHSKNNSGSGSFTGNSFANGNPTLINDTDAIDAPINDQDIKPSGTLQQL